MSSDKSMPSMGEDMDVFTMDNTDMPNIDHEDTREELEPDLSPAVSGGWEGRREGEEWREVGREGEGNGEDDVLLFL